MSHSARIMLALVLGIATGLFFGEPMGSLAVVGRAFVKLLQMTVLPYVVTSLIAGLGRLEAGVARSLAVRGGLLLLMLWSLALALVALTPLAFPTLATASFFSTTLVQEAEPFDFVELYIPSNPFYSLANNLVPAVVLFSIAVGVALMGMERKERLIEPFEMLGQALHRVSSFILKLMPIGVFAIGASAAGTMQIDEAMRIQIFVAGYVLGALGLTFLVLPGLVSALTPIPFREIVGLGRGILVTAFATGSEFIVLPIIADRAKELIRQYAPGHRDTESLVDVVVPVAFSFPHIAKLLSLAFVPFGAWFSGTELEIWDYPVLWGSGVVTLFGSINLAMPFLLNLMQVPEDLFQLFLATGIINARFGTLLAAAHITALTILASCAIGGGFRPRWLRALALGAGSLAVVAAAFVGVRLGYASFLDPGYSKDEVLQKMQLRQHEIEPVVYREPRDIPPLPQGVRRLDAIRERGDLRVCYRQGGLLPFAFFNREGELVGISVEMAIALARDLDVGIVFVPVEATFAASAALEAGLARGDCDIGIAGNVMSLSDVVGLDYSRPYLELTLGLLTRDHQRRRFADLRQLVAMKGVRLAVPNDAYFLERMHRKLPDAQLIPVGYVEEFLDADEGEYDAMIFLAEAASAWTLLRPEFAVVVPQPGIQEVPMAFQLPESQPDWTNTVNVWIELKKRDGTIQRLYDYWILGREAEKRGPRWSIARDVLGWID